MRRRLVVGLVVAAALASGCSFPEDESEQVSVSRSGPVVVLTSSAPGRSDVNVHCITSGTPAVCASSFQSPSANVTDLYLFGLAPARAASFQTTPNGTAKIQGDTFLAVIPGAANTPVQGIHWSFLAGDGTILAEGDGPND